MSISAGLRDEVGGRGRVDAMNLHTATSDLISLLSADPFRQVRELRRPVDVALLRQRSGFASAPDEVWEQAYLASGLTLSLVFPGMLYRNNEEGSVEFLDLDAAARDLSSYRG